MKSIFALLLMTFSFQTVNAQISIPLDSYDQRRLTKELSRIDFQYKTEEIIQEQPQRIIKKTYSYLSESDAFYLNCSEKFIAGAVNGIGAECKIGFNYEASSAGYIVSQNGFISDFAIAEINHADTAKILYKTIGNGTSPVVSFVSNEQLMLTHPETGNKFMAFRLRIECKRDSAHQNYSCLVSATK